FALGGDALAFERRFRQRAYYFLRDRFRHLDGRMALADLDRADRRAGDVGLSGDRPDEVFRPDAALFARSDDETHHRAAGAAFGRAGAVAGVGRVVFTLRLPRCARLRANGGALVSRAIPPFVLSLSKHGRLVFTTIAFFPVHRLRREL